MRPNNPLFSAALTVILLLTGVGFSQVHAVAPACQTIGPQKGLVIGINFPSDPSESKPISEVGEDYFGSADSLQDYWDEVSYGQTTMTGDALGWFTLNYPGWEDCDIYEIRSHALEAASAFVDVTEYNRIFLRVVKHPQCLITAVGQGTGCSEVALPGGGSMEASTSWNYTDSNGVIFHEAGHNLGLSHSGSEDYGSTDSIGPVGVYGTFDEYGDLFDVMGVSNRTGHYNAAYKHQIDMITDADVISVATTGTYVIEPLTVAGTGTKALRIFRGAKWEGANSIPPFRKEHLWVETRKETGYDANIRRATDDAHTVYGGALIHIDHDFIIFGYLLDMHPGSSSLEFGDAAMIAGETFTDPFTNITIDHDGVSSPGGEITLTVTIANPDSDADGISDATEMILLTNPYQEHSDGDTLTDFFEVCFDDDCSSYNPGVTDLDANSSDTDGDGMPDDYELDNTLDPLVHDSSIDGDADGLTNLEEYQSGTNPSLADTDSDNLSDGDEVNVYGTDPLDGSDTDEDGMSDDWESIFGTNPAINDAYTDSDTDGVDNAIEYLRDTLPLDDTSTPLVTTIYVDASNPGGDGSELNPYGLLDSAFSAVQDGDTIIIASGAYSSFFLFLQKSFNLLGPADRSASISAGFFIHSNAIWGETSGVTLLLNGATNFYQTIRNMTVKNCRIETSGDIIFSDVHMTFKNCTFIGPGDGSGLGLAFQSGGATQFINSTIIDFARGLYVVNGDPGLIVRNSILNNDDDLFDVSNTVGFQYNLIGDGDLAGTNGNVTGTPLFVDAANGDYHLQASSIAIDAGDPSDGFALEPENDGDRVNMGAYGNTTEATAGNDMDGDGLTDQNEWCYDGDCGGYDAYHPTSNPAGGDLDINEIDTDADGYNDDAEIAMGTDPLDSANLPPSGDVNDDGVVDTADILLAYRIAFNLYAPTISEFRRADVAPLVSGVPVPDMQITAGDIILITRKALGMVGF